MKSGRGSTAFPVKFGCDTVPLGVRVCVCVGKAEPVKVSAGTVPGDPVNVSAGTVPALPVNVSAGTVCVCVAIAEPVNVSAGTVRFGDVALQAVVDPVPAAMFVAAQFPLVAVAAFVPAGVPADVAPLVAVPFVPAGVKLTVPFVPAGVKLTVPFVPAGVPALTADVAPADPLKVG